MHEQAAAHVCMSAGTRVHVVEDTTQSPEIRADTGFWSLQNLRSSVGQRTYKHR